MNHVWHPVDGLEGVTVRYAKNPLGRTIITGVHIERDAVTSEMLRRIPLGRIEAAANVNDGESDPVVDLPPLSRKGLSPDEFSKLVARHYRAWARISSRPAVEMARGGTNVRTVHTWIREARLRGHLPPGRQGVVS